MDAGTGAEATPPETVSKRGEPLHQLGQVDAIHVACAFGFFAFRVAHSAIHCTYNHIMQRFTVYAIASGFLWVMALRLAFATLGDVL